MILYFSATGNGKYIAEKIAERVNEECMSIVDCIANNRYEFKNEEVLGVVSPTYFWRLPRIVAEYLKKIKIENCAYTFILVSYGTSTGMAKEMASSFYNFDAYYSVVMPDTWTPMFDLTNKEKVNDKLNKGEEQLGNVLNNIDERRKGDFVDKKLPKIVALLPSKYMYNTERKTKLLHVNNDLCVGCGLCAKKCPVKAIEMFDGKPKWVVDECEMCLGCLHRCPKFAISYGDGKTNKHGQYHNPDTKI